MNNSRPDWYEWLLSNGLLPDGHGGLRTIKYKPHGIGFVTLSNVVAFKNDFVNSSGFDNFIPLLSAYGMKLHNTYSGGSRSPRSNVSWFIVPSTTSFPHEHDPFDWEIEYEPVDIHSLPDWYEYLLSNGLLPDGHGGIRTIKYKPYGIGFVTLSGIVAFKDDKMNGANFDKFIPLLSEYGMKLYNTYSGGSYGPRKNVSWFIVPSSAPFPHGYDPFDWNVIA
jgi:hypothetical protein